MTVQELAERYSKCFTSGVRDDGTKFRKLTEDAPEEIKELVQVAHADMFADDLRYEFIEEAIDALAAEEDSYDVTLEADIYTHELTGWLHSRADRYGYCDEAKEEWGGEPVSVITLLQWGQAREKNEVLSLVRQWLEKRAEEEG